MKQFYELAKSKINDCSRWIVVILLVVASLTPMIDVKKASSAQLTSRKVTMTSSKASQTGVNYTFNFTLPGTTAVQSIIFQFCTTPLGTCTHPTGMDNNFTTTSTSATQTFSEATLFTEFTSADAGDCTDHNNGTPADSTQYCVIRTDTDAETAAAKAITIDSVTNPSTYASFYVRISVYSDAAFTTSVHTGVVAGSTARQLTVNGVVQENLEFCVAAIAGTITADGDTPADCTAMGTATTLNLGVIESSAATISPTSVANGGNETNGGVLTRTNASNGATVSYWAQQETSSGEFKVTGASCDESNTDQCFNNPGAGTQASFATSGEKFGFTAYPKLHNGETDNLTIGGNYDGDGTAAGGFAWVDGGTVTQIASSSTVLDYELLVLRFAARAATTTPTGSYTVTTGFIATPTF